MKEIIIYRNRVYFHRPLLPSFNASKLLTISLFTHRWNTKAHNTVKNFQEDLPVGGNADVLLIDVVIQKHSAWILPSLFPKTNPTNTQILIKWCARLHSPCKESLVNPFDWGLISPVNAEVKPALLFQLRKQLFFGLSDSHAFGKHRVQKELAGLRKWKEWDWRLLSKCSSHHNLKSNKCRFCKH